MRAGSAPYVDLAITKTATPGKVAPGDAVTYRLTYTNRGTATAQNVVITDHLPPEILDAGFTSTGAPVTQSEGATFEWEVEDLAAGAGGVITITGTVDGAVADGTTIKNTATISAPQEAAPEDNQSEATITSPCNQP